MNLAVHNLEIIRNAQEYILVRNYTSAKYVNKTQSSANYMEMLILIMAI